MVPLTLYLSHGERERCDDLSAHLSGSRSSISRKAHHSGSPLPAGEGQGEGLASAGGHHPLRVGRAIALLIALCLAPVAAGAHSYRLGAIEIGHVWALPSKDGATSVYGPLLNTGKEADTLTGVAAAEATSVTLRKTQDGKAVALDTLALPPGKPVTLAAWGAHIAVSGLRHPLNTGDSFELTLRFASAGAIKVKVLVQPRAAEP